MASFVDQVVIHVRGGSGGAGVPSFLRQKGKPRGKPVGGSGGAGGSVIVVADDSASTLLRYARKPHWKAPSGTHGEGELRHGRAGEDLMLEVPLGTLVRDLDQTLLADLVEPGQQVTIARGGRAGRGNAALVARNRKAPTFAEQGEYGEELSVILELKLIADAALVGYPNAGKSTLISRVSEAKPKIADYPFTTLTPNLGVVAIGDNEFVLADIPGLIEGAADGKGLGHEFLRHVERARVLVILLDPTPLQTVSPQEQYAVLLRELEEHSPELAARRRVVALAKADALDSVADYEEWAAANHITLYPISGVTGDGVDALMYAVADEIEGHLRESPDRAGYVLHRPLPDGYSISRVGEEWVVSGRAAERAVNLDDLTVAEAADFAARRLARIGVNKALVDAGAVPGDDVRIGDIVFTYDPGLGDDDQENGEQL
ncbi:MAG: GTPase ObgE [bacterium]|nr:GTPase ObgE [bacterium]MCP4965932.1 GTPase ObgE [bacterium]